MKIPILKGKQKAINIPHKAYDPYDFITYVGQDNVKKRLTLRFDGMTKGQSFKVLLFAPFGQGKTTLARVLAREMFNRGLIENYVETVAGRFETKSDLDRFLTYINPYTLIFIDEIHGLPSIVMESLYPAIQDGMYPFQNGISMSPLPTGLSWVGATTELGKVHPALQRRLIPINLEPLNEEDRTVIAQLQEVHVSTEAAREIAKRCWSPWEIKDEIYQVTSDIIKLKNKPSIDLEDVIDACDILGIDKNSLRPQERRVLESLYTNPRFLRRGKVFAMAKGPLLTVAGIDNETFSTAIEPKLLRLGFMSVASTGRELTTKAIKEYFNGPS